ncbi:transcriptional repressor [Subtercola boreus]|uniref:Transcriptional repressor n=1 Tax=Subtercola boreus TaxID=120213 RepID=A0A3E0VP34_9MICO|nr:Fur family transcriptional regulator [Subtercola boreus]RFA10597.1 transcriptional repressor [Subtercola boreus]TQL55855.1 Fur family ferric uptake transcriptional regulator [Subtercola boreus]
MTRQAEDSIRASGLRVTTQRLAVLEALDHLPHADTDAVHRRVLQTHPTITVQSVYVVLAALTEAGLIRRIEPAGSPALYERRIGDNHHHAICTQCGAVQDVDCAVGRTPCLEPSGAGSFAIASAEVTYWGLCAACQATAAH